MFERNYLSMIPGPIQIGDSARLALSTQVVSHMDPDWNDYYLVVARKVAQLFGTTGDLFIMVSSGTGGAEAAVSSMLEPGERLLVLTNGLFGDRFEWIAESYRVEPVVMRFPNNRAINAKEVEAFLKKEGKTISAISVAMCESQNGVLNPVKELAEISNRYDIPIIVDAVSALGGVEFEQDKWGVDVALGATQKCVSSVAGLAMMGINGKAWKYFENKKGTGFYFNFNRWRESMAHNKVHPHPWSMSEAMVRALDASVTEILDEGLENVWKRHKDLYHFYVKELGALGFEMFLTEEDGASPNVISIKMPDYISFNDFFNRMKNEQGILIGGGLFEQKNKIFRIGNMGSQATKKKAEFLIEAIYKVVKPSN